MPDKFQNKYRIPSARLPGWNYGWAAAYFVTICTKDRECFFGEIVETQCTASLSQPQMQLSEIGKIAEMEWLKTPEIRADMNLELGEFIVMPNHIHGIIIIGENEFNTQRDDNCNERRRDAMHGVSETNDSARGRDAMHGVSTFGPQSKNLSSIIRGYKSAVKKYATVNNINFAWQPRFHDHIIRDEQSFRNISNYIINNPTNWKQDKFLR
jgi:REP element-mobilizing transposase RayT